jgi:hypothetical protein
VKFSMQIEINAYVEFFEKNYWNRLRPFSFDIRSALKLPIDFREL